MSERVRRRLAVLLLGVFAVFSAVPPAQAQAERMAGRFVGIAEAQGMVLDLSVNRGRLVGQFTDSNGVTAQVDAQLLGNAAEAVLTFPSRRVKVRLFPESVGLRMIAIPLDEAGQPVQDQINALVFVPPGTRIPDLPDGYTPPSYRVRVVDPDTFLLSYAFWPPEAVAFGYESVEARYRPMFALFPFVQGDVLWKLCASTYQPAALGEALRGQGVTCRTVLEAFDRMQAEGRFAAWKAEVAKEQAVLMRAVRCARGYIVKPEVCQPAARAIADRAVSLNTVASVLRRF